jgi:hypothetical protein
VYVLLLCGATHVVCLDLFRSGAGVIAAIEPKHEQFLNVYPYAPVPPFPGAAVPPGHGTGYGRKRDSLPSPHVVATPGLHLDNTGQDTLMSYTRTAQAMLLSYPCSCY